jgi:AcrR family transcriptional regulator
MTTSSVGLDRDQRERLRHAVATAVAEQGCEGTTIDDLAERADVPAATLGAHFGDSAGCVAATYADATEYVVSLVADASTEGGSVRERFRRGLDALLRFCDREPVVARMCLVETSAGGEAGLARHADAIARLARLVQPARNGDGGPTLASVMLVGAVHQVVGARLVAGNTRLRPLGPEIETALLPFLDALAVDGGPRPHGGERTRPGRLVRRSPVR